LVESVPDTQFTQICQSNCCACEEEAHAAYSNAVKNRTFTISGSISVLETLAVQEMGQGEQNSQGYSEKDTICETNHASGGLGAGNQCVEVKCPPASIQLGAQAPISTTSSKSLGLADQQA
jgi:hypothetical protein